VNFLTRMALVDIEDDAAEQLLSSEEAKAFVEHAATEGAKAAAELTPAHELKDKMRVTEVTVEDGVATCAFWCDSPIWHIIEFGSKNNPPYRPMTAAAERVTGFTP
jgi:hypothetical protein